MILSELVTILGLDYRGEGEARKMKADIDGLERRVIAFTRSLGQLAATAGAAFVGIQIGQSASAFVASITEAGAKTEELNLRLKALEGSMPGAEKAREWIKAFQAANPILSIEEVVESYAKAKGFGLDPTKTLQSLVDTMAATGGGTERLEGIVLALGQAWTKQKLQAEEANQLMERGVPVWELLSQATGKNGAELMELAEKGKIGRKEIQLLIDTLGKKFAGTSAELADSFTGMRKRWASEWLKFQNAVADAGYFDRVKQRFRVFLDWINEGWRDGTLKRAAETVSKTLVTTMDVAWHLARQAYLIGRGFYYAADGVLELMGRVNGLGKLASGGILGAALIGSSAFGRKAMLALARKSPLLAGFLVLDDLLTALDGGDSVIGGLDGAQEAIAEIKKSLADAKAAAEGFADTWNTYVGVNRLAGETSIGALLRSFKEFASGEVVRFLREMGDAIKDVAVGLRAMDTFLQNPSEGIKRMVDAMISQLDRLVKAVDEKLGGALTRFGFIGTEQLAREPHDYPRIIPRTGKTTRAAPTPITMTPMGQLVRDGMQQVEGLMHQFKGTGISAEGLTMVAELMLKTTEFMNPASAAKTMMTDLARTYEARLDLNIGGIEAKVAHAKALISSIPGVSTGVGHVIPGVPARASRPAVIASPSS